MKYKNPVIPGFYPDPSVCRVGDDYYLVTSTFAYFPGVPIFHSKDLVHWRQIGHCLTRESQLPLDGSGISGGIFAPTIRYHNGRFYMVTTNVDHGGHFYVWTEDPAGEWSDPIYVDQPGIDPILFFDDDGKVYFTSTNHLYSTGILLCEIDLETGKKLTESRTIWTGTGGAYPEAPHFYKKDGYYYLMLAEGGTEYGHMVTIARSQSPYGPYEACPYNPILSHRSLRHPIQATGHADLIEDQNGNWWAVFLGIRPIFNSHHLGRETFLAPVRWTEDGWPIIGNDGFVELEMEADTLPFVEWGGEDETDDFDGTALGMKWNFIRSPKVDWSLDERKGWLAVKGSGVGLPDKGTPAFIGRRQQHFDCDISVRMEYDPQAEDEAGLAVFMDERHHYAIGVARHEGKRAVVFRRQISSLVVKEYVTAVESDVVELRIEANPLTYVFAYRTPDGQWQTVGEAETRYVSSEVAGGFTGVYIGMYNESAAGTKAYFDWFKYSVKA